MHACGRCRRSWWECDGAVVEFSQALSVIKGSAIYHNVPPEVRSPGGAAEPQRVNRPAPGAGAEPHPEPEPAAFLALLSWVGHSIGTDLVLFAADGPAGWHTVSYPRPGTGANGATPAGTADQELASPAQALHDEALLDAVAEQRRPTEITQAALANICSRLVDAGVRCVVGASIYAPSGRLAAVILAAYREQGLAEQFPPFALVSWAGRETVGCMGKLLATAHSALRAIPASASKVDVSPRTVANWALSGGWRAYWY